ncbi:RagB/SusD family nutrient uptake outer membrane protein [Butyricimonas faecihominis]
MKKYVILTIAVVASCLTACKDYLDQVPENDIETFETIFERRSTADVWFTQSTLDMANNFVGFFTPGVIGADEFVTGDYERSLGAKMLNIPDGLQLSQKPIGDVWGSTYYSLRLLNTFIQRIVDVYDMTEAEKINWRAEAMAVKAFYYFELVKRYGPIVLVPTNIDVNVDLQKMQVPRSHVDTCFNEIVRLLDEAIPDLYYSKEREASHKLFPSKEGAMALKAKVLLYQASPLFNGNDFYVNFKGKDGEPLFNTKYDPEKWKRAAEAADEVVALCESLGYKLITGDQDKATNLLNDMRDIELSIWEREYDGVEAVFMTGFQGALINSFPYLLPNFPEGYPEKESSARGTFGPSMKMVESFYTKNGLPLNMDKEWPYANRYKMGREVDNTYQGVVALNEDVLNLHLRREPRFYAHIAADRCYWQRGPVASKNLEVQAYRGEAFGLHESYLDASTRQNICGYYVKKYTRTEVQTSNYRSNSAVLGDCRWPVIRLAELYLMQAEAWNEYLNKPDDRVYEPLNKVRRRAGIPDVQDAWKKFSTHPQQVENQAGMREIIRQEKTVEFAFEGHRFWDLRRWKTAHLELNDKILGWNVLGDNARTFYNNYEGPVVVWSKVKFISPRDYLFPIKAEEVMISGYVQNPGW